MVGHSVPYMEPPISPSTNKDAAFGRLRNNRAGAFSARPTVVKSIVVDGEMVQYILPNLAPEMVPKLNLRKDY